MSNKLFVGNLSDITTEDDLLYNFGELGTCLSAKIVRDRTTGKSKGFAFVEMASEKEAREVIRICKGVELEGKKLIVSEARPQQETTGPRTPGLGKRRGR